MDNVMIAAESNSEIIDTSIRSYVITAQNKVYAAVNTAMVMKNSSRYRQSLSMGGIYGQSV